MFSAVALAIIGNLFWLLVKTWFNWINYINAPRCVCLTICVILVFKTSHKQNHLFSFSSCDYNDIKCEIWVNIRCQCARYLPMWLKTDSGCISVETTSSLDLLGCEMWACTSMKEPGMHWSVHNTMGKKGRWHSRSGMCKIGMNTVQMRKKT